MARLRAEDYDEKRLAILETAAELFASKSFSRVSISEIAKACNASKAWLYHYYDSKEAVLYDMLVQHLHELKDAVDAADDHDAEPVERLRKLVAAVLDAYRDADKKHKVQINDLPILPQHQQDELKAMERDIVKVFADAILAVNPHLNDNRPLLKPVTMSLFGMLNWHYMWFRPGGHISREDYVDIVTEIIVNGAKDLK